MCCVLAGLGSGCASTRPLPPDVRSLAVVDRMDANPEPTYEDATSRAYRFALGGMIGAGLSAANQTAGLQKFDFLTGENAGWLRGEVKSACESALARSSRFRVASGPGAGDAEVGLYHLTFGYRHDTDQRFKLNVAVTYYVTRRGTEKYLTEYYAEVESAEAFTVDEYRADRARTRRVLSGLAREAAEQFVAAVSAK